MQMRMAHRPIILLLLVAAASCWISAANAADQPPSNPSNHRLIQQLMQPFGLRPYDFADTGRGLQTVRDRSSNEVLMQIPIDETWTAARFLERYPTLQQALQQQIMNCTDEQVLALGLCFLSREEQEKDKDVINADSLYISMLPRPHASIFTMPDELYEKCLTCLPRCYQEICHSKRSVANDLWETAKLINLFPSDAIQKDDVMWAFSMVRSRSVAAPALSTEGDESYPHALIPGFDLFNHKFGARTTLTYYPNHGWQVKAKESYRKDDQVWLSYGDDKDNWTFWWTYGFCLKDNPNVLVVWDFDDLMDAAAKARPDMFTLSIRQMLRDHPPLAPYMMQRGEHRARFSYDCIGKKEGGGQMRENLQSGLALLQNVAGQLGLPEDEKDALAHDIFLEMVRQRREELRVCLDRVHAVTEALDDFWCHFFTSLKLVLEQELFHIQALINREEQIK